MNARAELTLRLAHLVQARYAPPRSPAVWSLAPEVGHATWPEMVGLLAAVPKPCLVAPLVEPGALGLWTLATMSASGRAILMREVEYGVAYLGEKLRGHGIADADRVRLGTEATAFTLRVPEFMQWAGEYAMAGISLSVTRAEPGLGQIVIKPPDAPPGPAIWTAALVEAPVRRAPH